MNIFGIRFRYSSPFAAHRTVFLWCLLLGLLVSGWMAKPVIRTYVDYVYLTPGYRSWADDEGRRIPIRNCLLLAVKLDEKGRLALNSEPNGTICDLSILRKRLEQIIDERREKVAYLDLGPGAEKKFGYRIVNAEFLVQPAENSKYGDFVRLVDLATSFSPSVVYVETPSYAQESDAEFQDWVNQNQVDGRE